SGLLHLPAQVLHLGHGEAGIVSNDHDIGVLEDTIEFRDQLLLSRSFHCKLFPVWRPEPMLWHRRLRPAPLSSRAGTALISCPSGAAKATRSSKVRTGRGTPN